MDAYMIVFRIIHIGSAILWAGSALFFYAFVGPTVENTLGSEAGKFFNYLVRQRKAVIFYVAVSTLTIVAGAFLYWRDSAGLDFGWMQTGPGIGFTVGAIAGIISWVLVLLVLAPTSYRLVALGGRIAAAGVPPSQEQVTGLQALQRRLKSYSLLNLVFLGIATISMATARYLNF